jgi:hypothetical protein
VTTVPTTQKKGSTGELGGNRTTPMNIDSQEETRMSTTSIARELRPLPEVKPEPHPACSMGTAWCDAKTASHNCATDAAYLPGIVRVVGSTADAPPIISACAWANEEDRGLSVNVNFLADGGEGTEVEGWFDPATARALAAQLLEAADLVDGTVR